MLSEGRLKQIRESLSWDDEAQRFCPEVADLLAEIDRTRGFDQCVEALDEILNYTGGADTVLDDLYVMTRAHAALAAATPKEAKEGKKDE